ncbi:MAG: hypothetical protein HRU75_14715 [Planctomycetia bacterium]|nr:MAG: hypothetical protein HRU75_14715 [Planctomycetia bacterium]
MSFWTYTMPLWGGVFLGAIVAINGMPPEADWGYWLRASAGVALFSLWCQLAFIGYQGASVAVLPAPGGRSIRGGGATFTGSMMLITAAFVAAAVLLTLREFGFGVTVAGIGAGSFGLAAAAAYFWNLATAVADFRERV